MSRRRPVRQCVVCGRHRPHIARGECATCYRRRFAQCDRGTGAGRGGPGVRRTAADIAARIEDYVHLRSAGVSRADAARRIGVSYRTVSRYIARLRQEATPQEGT